MKSMKRGFMPTDRRLCVKRSEMVAELNVYMDDKLNDFFSMDQASALLAFLEKRGMVPPGNGVKGFDGYGTPMLAHEWEDESEV